MKKIVKYSLALGFAASLTACSTFANNPKEAPCGPLASLDNPCDDREPINGIQTAMLGQSIYLEIARDT